MWDIRKSAVCIVIGFAFSTGASAIVADSGNPYQGIVERNVFGLKPPPPPPTNAPVKVDAPPIILNGVTTLNKRKRALLTLQPQGKPAKSFILAEGERDTDIEVLEIHEKEPVLVRLRAFGNELSLDFEKNGPKFPSAPPAVPTPNPVGFIPQPPAANPGVAPAGGPPGGFKQIPTRTLRLPSAGERPAGSSSSVNPSGSPGYTYNGAGLNLGVNATPAPIHTANPIAPPQLPVLNPEEQAVGMLAQHVDATSRGQEMPPLPPPLAEVLQEQAPQTPQQSPRRFQNPPIPGQPLPPTP